MFGHVVDSDVITCILKLYISISCPSTICWVQLLAFGRMTTKTSSRMIWVALLMGPMPFLTVLVIQLRA